MIGQSPVNNLQVHAQQTLIQKFYRLDELKQSGMVDPVKFDTAVTSFCDEVKKYLSL